jgi:hypothetical protein
MWLLDYISLADNTTKRWNTFTSINKSLIDMFSNVIVKKASHLTSFKGWILVSNNQIRKNIHLKISQQSLREISGPHGGEYEV